MRSLRCQNCYFLLFIVLRVWFQAREKKPKLVLVSIATGLCCADERGEENDAIEGTACRVSLHAQTVPAPFAPVSSLHPYFLRPT